MNKNILVFKISDKMDFFIEIFNFIINKRNVIRFDKNNAYINPSNIKLFLKNKIVNINKVGGMYGIIINNFKLLYIL